MPVRKKRELSHLSDERLCEVSVTVDPRSRARTLIYEEVGFRLRQRARKLGPLGKILYQEDARGSPAEQLVALYWYGRILRAQDSLDR